LNFKLATVNYGGLFAITKKHAALANHKVECLFSSNHDSAQVTLFVMAPVSVLEQHLRWFQEILQYTYVAIPLLVAICNPTL